MISRINQNVIEAARIIRAQYLLTGNVYCRERQIHTRINLLNTATGEFLISKVFEHEAINGEAYKIQKEIITTFVTAIDRYFGFILKTL